MVEAEEMDFSSFLTSLGTSFIIFLVLMLIFTWLSRKPSNTVIYYPNRILRGLDPWEGKKTRNPFSWIGEAFRSSEADVIAVAGVDAAVYFVFMSSGMASVLFILTQSSKDIARGLSSQETLKCRGKFWGIFVFFF